MDTMLSVFLSSVIAIAITWYFTRKQMKKNEIIHFSINSYNVGRGLHNEFPKFAIELLILAGFFAWVFLRV